VPSRLLIAVLLLALPILTRAEQPVRRPLPAGHPLVGTWRIDLPQAQCHELYVLRADGTGSVSSGEERGESEFEAALEPDEQGFYKWTDRVTADNGKPDCMGNVTPVGDVAVTWIRMHPSGKQFLMCLEENLRQCIGPFIRQEPI